MAKGFMFTAPQVKRVARVVRAHETSGPALANKSTVPRKETPEIWGELTGESPTSPGHYSWKLKDVKGPCDGTFKDPTKPYVIAEFTARAINPGTGSCLPPGTIVRLTFVGYDINGDASYVFHAPHVMRWGKAPAAWTTGNTITLAPCKSSIDGTSQGAASRAIYLYLPTSYTVLADSILIAADAILGFWPFDESGTPKGVLASVPVKTGPCITP